MLRYEIAITNTPVAADSEILESFTTEPHTTADPLLTKSFVLIRVAKCMFGGGVRAHLVTIQCITTGCMDVFSGVAKCIVMGCTPPWVS